MSTDPASLVRAWLSLDRPGRIELRVGKVEIGQGASDAIVRIAAEELDVTPSIVDLVAGDTALTPDEVITAGSLSITTCGATVRRAAATLRHALAACVQGNAADIAFVNGELHRDGHATGENYWTLASRLPPELAIDPNAATKPPANYRLVGQPRGRDLRRALTGNAFIQDLELPGMLHARMVRPPNAWADLADLPHVQLPDGARVVRDGNFVGVIAPNEYDAVRLAEALAARCTWVPRDGTTTPDAAVDGDWSEAALDDHDVAPASNRVVHGDASRGYLAHASIGLCCAIAEWDGTTLRVWSHTQGPYPLRTAIARLLSLPVHAVRVTHVPGAGCYGHNGADDVAADAAMLAMHRPGAPIRVQWTRAQELSAGPLAPAMRTRVTFELDDSGRITRGWTRITSLPHTRRPGSSGGVNLLAGYLRADAIDDPIGDPPLSHGGGADRNALPGYAIPEHDVRKTIVAAPRVRTSALRSLGAHVNVTAVERAMDEAAALANEDAIAFRLRHLDDARARAVLEAVARAAKWPRPGLGVGYARYKNSAGYCAVIVQASLDERVVVDAVWAAADVGCAIDPDGVRNQVEGGIVQALSWSLLERARVGTHAAPVEGWADYDILRFDAVPPLHIEVLQHLDAPTLGAGEIAAGPCAAALANAVSGLTGVPLAHFPLDNARIRRAFV